MNRRYKTVNFLACVYSYSRPEVFLKALPFDFFRGEGLAIYTGEKVSYHFEDCILFTVRSRLYTLVYSLAAVFQREKWPPGFWIKIIYQQPPYVKTNELHNAFLGS